MSDEKKSVSFEGQVDLAQVQAYLKDLQAGFKAGTVWVQHGAEIVGLTPEATVGFSLEARRKKDKQGLKITIEWERTEEAAEGAGALSISAKEPEGVIVEESE